MKTILASFILLTLSAIAAPLVCHLTGYVAHYYPNGLGNVTVPIAQVCIRTNYAYTFDPKPEFFPGDGTRSDQVKARLWLADGKLDHRTYRMMISPEVQRHIMETVTPVYVVVLNPTSITLDNHLDLSATFLGAKEWHMADGTPVRLPTYDCHPPDTNTVPSIPVPPPSTQKFVTDPKVLNL
jgi:hypothetical protein